MNIYIPNLRLPSEYQEVEYIQSDGGGNSGQHIDTNFTPTNNTKVEFKISNWTQSGSYQIFGADNNWNVNGFSIVTDAYNFYEPISVNHGLNNGGTHEGSMSQEGLYVDGTLKATPGTYTFTSPCTMSLFCLNRRNSRIEHASFRMYYFKIYENSELVHNFIPCYRKSDSVIGMYDLVNDQFYTNSGSGTFTKGADVYTNVLQNAYIGEYKGWTPGANTVAYYPLKNNTNDETGNTTLSGTMVQDGLGYKPTTAITINLGGRQPMFIGYWINILSRPSSNISSPISENIGVGYYLYHVQQSSLRKKIFCFYNSSYAQSTAFFEPSLNTWHHLAIGYDGTKTIYAIDGVVGTLYNGKGYNFNNAISIDGGGGYYIVSDLISETVCWTADEIADYYNQTKSNYGL